MTPKKLGIIVEDYTIKRVRWTRPRTKKGKPILNRRNIHLADWDRYIQQNDGVDPDGWPTAGKDDIKARAREIREARRGVSGSIGE